jgi:shikimate dehydrogenase
MAVSGKTLLCGVIGDPIEHTLSPVMHNAAFKKLGLDFVFLAFRVKSSEVENALKGMRGLGIRGLNVTMPNKDEVIKYLDALDQTAKFLGSANTILNDNGKLLGYSTDGAGAVEALKNNGVQLKGKKILVLGAGGAAKAIAFACARDAEETVILNRTAEKAMKFAEALNQKFNKKAVGGALSSRNLEKKISQADVLINATSTGMWPQENQSLVPSKWLRPDMTVMDIVYNPLETKLMKDAKAASAKVISGVEMLIYQGAASFKVWTGNKAPIETMREAVLTELSNGGQKE